MTRKARKPESTKARKKTTPVKRARRKPPGERLQPPVPMSIEQRWNLVKSFAIYRDHTHLYWLKVLFFARALDPEAAALDDTAREADKRNDQAFWNRAVMNSAKVIWLSSTGNHKLPGAGTIQIAGRVISATPWNAALRLVGGTHRLATKKEIAGWHAEQKQRKLIAADGQPWLEVEEANAKGLVFYRSTAADPVQPIAPVAPEGLNIVEQLALNWQIIQGWFRALWKHPRLEALRLYFYRPTVDNDDWLQYPLKREKVLKRVLDVMSSDWKPEWWREALEHWEYLAIGACFGTAFWLGFYLVAAFYLVASK